MQKNAVAAAPSAAHIGSPHGATSLTYFRNFAFDRVAALWQCRAGETLLNLKWERMVAKPEWGSKRICPSCGARYYDLLREPVICPKCATPFDAEAFLKSRRTRPAPPVEKELEPVGADEIDAEVETEEAEAAEEEEEAVPLEEAEEEDEELLEDASELGEDEDDMAEVIENVEEEEH
jgi:uncharacterized protein (TIGR02300 family)